MNNTEKLESFFFKCDVCGRSCGHIGEPSLNRTPDGWLCIDHYQMYLSTLRSFEDKEEDLYSQ